jgi:flagellar hook-associated protein 1 FlgK
MSNLFASMRASATALDALQRSASASENNVTNASTPGYAKQRLLLKALDFDPSKGLTGGAVSGEMSSSRDQFIETAVRSQASKLGEAQDKAGQLALIESAFDLNSGTSISPNLDKLFRAFSEWSIAPSSTAAKENVIAAAADVAGSFNSTAGELARAGQNAETRIRTTLTNISDLASRIQQHNVDIRKGGASDAGVDASMHSDLEQLADLVDAQVVWQDDGTATVLIGKQTPLVMGDRKFDFTVATSGGKIQVVDQDGADVTGNMIGGRIAALLDVRNSVVPGYVGTASDPGDLNRLAKTFADRVNDLLTAGDPDPSLSVKLFEYAGPGSEAASLRVNPNMNAGVLSASDLTKTPPVANGRALTLAGLAHPVASADMIDSMSFVGFIGKISADVGRVADEANTAIDSRRQMLAQARTMRDAVSGVSMDEEAVALVQFQRAYQATARMVSVLDEISKMAVNIGRV